MSEINITGSVEGAINAAKEFIDKVNEEEENFKEQILELSTDNALMDANIKMLNISLGFKDDMIR